VRAKVKAARRDRLAERLLGDGGGAFVEDIVGFGEGYVAVVHVDGNAVGRRVQRLGGDLEALSRFSEALGRATQDAAQDAVRALARRGDDGEGPAGGGGRSSPIQARPIVLGGDDFTAIVHGRFALPFTERLLRRFEEATSAVERRRDLGDGLTACAGVAFVKPGWPFHAAYALSESLCRAAKAALRDRDRSGLLFHRVTTSSADLDWREISKGELSTRDPAARDGRVLSDGPYDLDRLKRLEVLAERASLLPRGGLRGWLATTRVSLARAQARWDRLAEVAKKGNDDRWTPFATALEALAADPRTGWTSAGTTPVADAVAWATMQPGGGPRLWRD
jgi:hypothetical protein